MDRINRINRSNRTWGSIAVGKSSTQFTTEYSPSAMSSFALPPKRATKVITEGNWRMSGKVGLTTAGVMAHWARSEAARIRGTKQRRQAAA
jgi:hypothetical protein